MSPSRGIKRSADGAQKSHNAPVSLEGRKGKKPTPGKVVNFEDGPQVSSNSTGSSGPTNLSNLKQRSKDLVLVRQQLPIWNHADEIRARLKTHDVLLLVGETGSGKSTQIPQFLLNEPWCQRRKLKNGASVGGCIAVTEPRRVAAISLARRVAEEIGTPLGSSSPASQVGYSIRFDNSTGPSTKIKFLTEGMLLQEILRDAWLKNYSAVVVDEVHERGLNVDLVLGFLRRMHEKSYSGDERDGNKLKVIIMSATADMQVIQNYFGPTVNQSNETSKSKAEEKDEDEEWNGFSDDDKENEGEDSILKENEKPTAATQESNLNVSPLTTLVIKGRQYPVTIHYSPAPVPDILEASLQRVIDIHTHAPLPGDILVFLIGQETVESLMALLESYSASMRTDPKSASTLPDLLLLPLYAALPPQLQQRVFQPTPKLTRKVIIATNIAETSITVPGIRHVIDCGKHKRRRFRPNLNLESLLTTPISRSNANQRSGRAGRDAPGHAYRLYTEHAYYNLAADTEPEIMRCDLSHLVLTLKSHGVNDLSDYSLLTFPPHSALKKAIYNLLQLSAIDRTTGVITPLGREMSLLPLPSPLARILLSSSLPQYNCVDEIIDIVSALSVENIFLNIHHQSSNSNNNSDSDSESSNDPRLVLRSRLHRREGDHLTILATVQAYVDENTDRKRWCEERGISHRAMQAVMDARKQLTGIMKRRAQEQKKETKAKPNLKENGETPATTNGDGDDTQTEINRLTTTDAHVQKSAPTPSTIQENLTTRILKTLMTGLHSNVAVLSTFLPPTTASSSSSTPGNQTHINPNSTSYTTLSSKQQVHIHPSSVLFSAKHPTSQNNKKNSSSSTMSGGSKRPESIMFSEFVFTTKPYARCVSVVQMEWVSDMLKDLDFGSQG